MPKYPKSEYTEIPNPKFSYPNKDEDPRVVIMINSVVMSVDCRTYYQILPLEMEYARPGHLERIVTKLQLDHKKLEYKTIERELAIAEVLGA